ncbi:protein Mdm4 isoform X2 [Latimeria chalumnae]|uniref:Protein Mdm4 n=2 Tax=Latimeria chalumnae TaxID=7897 RepID=M3XGV2_LATCH|nr:PREDICTED: protein Mdm4 [Latimeria chalumnae]XP_005989281.1 PREDICTED: protein Mdm4 [Latimeria chalumnae]|eukprot:XP_005989280.1 PREDICTED: protein Mdm4 [Latimeria chalumnae]
MTTASTSALYPASENACRVTSEQARQVRPTLPLLKLLHASGAEGEIFTLKEVMNCLGQYIMLKQLYDKQQQHIVYCGNDPLGELIGVQSFSVRDPSPLYDMLRRNLTSVNSIDAAQTHTVAKDPRADTPSQESSKRNTEEEAAERKCASPTTSQRKRRSSSEDDSLPSDQCKPLSKQPKLDVVFEEWDVAGLPWWFLGHLRSNYECKSNGSTDLHSTQEVDTAIVTDTTDDLWFLNESDVEQVSVQGKGDPTDSPNITEDEKGDQTDEEKKKVLELSFYEEDREDFGCLSDDTDTDSTSEDCWRCTKCKKLNSPVKRYCFRCWALRKDWYLDCPKLVHSLSTPDITANLQEDDDVGIDIPDCRRTVSDPVVKTVEKPQSEEKPKTLSFSSLDLSKSSLSVIKNTESQEKLDASQETWIHKDAQEPSQKSSCQELLQFCCYCQKRPRNGNIVHGRTAHLVTCFRCARMLHKSKLPCPACKCQIQMVIKTFIA